MLIIGGDMRSAYLARIAAEAGVHVQAVGFEKLGWHGGVKWIAPEEAVPDACVVLAFPVSEKDGCIPAPFAEAPIAVERVHHLLRPGMKVFAGRTGPWLDGHAAALGITFVDPNADEAFAVANAVPSAEGAIFAAMGKCQACIMDRVCLIVGFGRIGQALAHRLRGLYATVIVAARRPEARACAEAIGCRTCTMKDLAKEAKAVHILFNTAPEMVVDEGVMWGMRKDSLLIDLASPPYGVDLDAAQALGLNAWREPGLPGRYSPESAARYLFDFIRREGEG